MRTQRNDAKFFNDLDDTAFSANVVASIQLADRRGNLPRSKRRERVVLDVQATGGHSLPLSRAFELGNDHRLIELRDGPEHLPDQLRCGGVIQERACGLSAATSLMPRACSLAKPTSCTHQVTGKR